MSATVLPQPTRAPFMRRVFLVFIWILIGVAIPEVATRLPAVDLLGRFRILSDVWHELAVVCVVLVAIYLRFRSVVRDGDALPIITEHDFALLHARFMSCARHAGYTGVGASLASVAMAFTKLWEHYQAPSSAMPPAVFIAPAVVVMTVSSLTSLAVQVLVESQWDTARARWKVEPNTVQMAPTAPPPAPAPANLCA